MAMVLRSMTRAKRPVVKKAKRVAVSRKARGSSKAAVRITAHGQQLSLRPAQPLKYSQENPKTSGSKSFQRYQRYSKARTVEQALRFGAKPSDIAWDLARGHARLTGAAQAQVTVAMSSPKPRSTKRQAVCKPGKQKPAPKKKFSGKQMRTKDGRIAIDRKFSNREDWEKRRKVEQPPPGGWPTPPAHWPPGVRVDIGKPVYWLPAGWGQGVKTTCATKLTTYVSPEGKCYYHRHVVEQVCGEDLGKPKDPAAAAEWARDFGKMCLSAGHNFSRIAPKFVADQVLFKHLSAAERAKLPSSGSDLHFAVISARRANDERGIRNIVNVQAALVAGGAKPLWYVDEASLKDYRKLGLNAKVGGKLVPARNLALSDAKKLGKPCVQVSDDITSWSYCVGENGRQQDLFAGNEAAKNAERLQISPVAAAKFLLAKMRADPDGPRLAGVFPLGNTGMAFTRGAVSKDHFILGDFFVAEGSQCKFDTRMTLKEDYDFTCSHLAAHGAVFRCNRMFVSAVHETNAGGACSERDAQGDKERANIAVLQEKWPGVFSLNGNRGSGDTQVIMSWRRRKF